MEWLIVILLIANLRLLGYFLWSRNKDPQDSQGLMLLQNQLQELSRTLEGKLGEGTSRMFDSMRAQFEQSQKLATDTRDLVHQQLSEVVRGVAETKESTKQVFTIAEQLQNLEKVLKHQKQRGNLGEA